MRLLLLITLGLIILLVILQANNPYTRLSGCPQERFKDMKPTDFPSPPEMFKKLRALIDKYDKPDVWNHAVQVHDKDPGQLARMSL